MRKPRLYKWDLHDNTEGLLLFAQSIEELLFHHTLDSFKAPALNTHLNILELHFLSVEILNKKVKSGALLPVLAELESRIKTDPVIEDKTELFIEYLEKLKKSQKDPDELFSTADSLLSEINNNYWDDLKKKIIETIPNKNEKKKIIALAVVFASEIELRGFNKHFLYFMTFNFFFNGGMPPKKIDHSGIVKEFLENFDGATLEWQVIFRCCSSFNTFNDHSQHFKFEIKEELPPGFDHGAHHKAFFEKDEIHPLFLFFDKIKAKDRFQARQFCNQFIEFFSDICRFHDHDITLSWKENCVARKMEEINFVQVKPPPAPMVRGMAPRIMSAGNLGRTVDIMRGRHFDSHSVFLFRKALDYHRAAAETNASENQLVSLWAALEGFLPPPKEDEGGSRINQLLTSILPSLSLSYVEKIFRYTSVCLKHSGKNVSEFIEGIDSSRDFFENALMLLTVQEFEELRVCLYQLLASNPLLRYRCHWCNDNFRNNKNIRKTILKHQERLTWHIQRIYITRNLIVHSAQSLPYLDALIENLHSYFDILINSVMKIGINSSSKVNIYSALKTLEINEKAYLRELEGEKVYCHCANYRSLLFGKNNPLNPFQEK